MPTVRVKIQVPANFVGWGVGFDTLKEQLLGEDKLWAEAGDLFYGRTQEYVHVITGDLKRSGRNLPMIPEPSGRLVYRVAYGNTAVDYAQKERDRGGDHDFYARADVATQPILQSALGQMWEAVVTRWG